MCRIPQSRQNTETSILLLDAISSVIHMWHHLWLASTNLNKRAVEIIKKKHQVRYLLIIQRHNNQILVIVNRLKLSWKDNNSKTSGTFLDSCLRPLASELLYREVEERGHRSSLCATQSLKWIQGCDEERTGRRSRGRAWRRRGESPAFQEPVEVPVVSVWAVTTRPETLAVQLLVSSGTLVASNSLLVS